jgi:uncharacterized protein (DUF433 family)
MNLLVDSDVLLDVATHRQPHFGDSKQVLDWCELHERNTFVAWHTRVTSVAIPAEDSSARVREEPTSGVDDYHAVITIEPGKRGGRACIRGMRITVGDVLGWLASGMSEKEILRDYPELTGADIKASLAYAAQREKGAEGTEQKLSRLSQFASRWGGKFSLPKSAPDDPRMDYLLKRYWRHRK